MKINSITVYCKKSNRKNSKVDYKTLKSYENEVGEKIDNIKNKFTIDNLYDFLNFISNSKYKNIEVVSYLNIGGSDIHIRKDTRLNGIEQITVYLLQLFNISNKDNSFNINNIFMNDNNLKYIFNKYYNKGV